MNLKQLIADGAYTAFARMNSENKLKQIESVQYIKQLSSQMEVNIDDWNIMEVFGTGRGNVLFLDKREINKRFLANAQKTALAATVTANPDTNPEIARMQTQLNSAVKSSLLNRIRDLENHRNSFLRDANSYFSEANAKLQRAMEYSNSIAALSKREIDFVGQIKTIEESGFWKFIKFENNVIHFHMNNDLYLHYVNRSSGQDIRLNFGKFRAELNPSAGSIKVYGLENNIPCDGGAIPHPHLHNGGVCWGSSHSVASQKITQFDFAGLMQLLANLLSDYNDGNPYRTMYDFKAMYFFLQANKMRNEGVGVAQVKKFLLDNDLEDYTVDGYFTNHDPLRRR